MPCDFAVFKLAYYSYTINHNGNYINNPYAMRNSNTLNFTRVYVYTRKI